MSAAFDEQRAVSMAHSLGREALGREPNADEADALATIARAVIGALRDGHIRRLAEQVSAERTDERVEEFFEQNLDLTR